MPMRTRRKMDLMETTYMRGDIVPDHVWSAIPEGRRQALERTGLIVEMDDQEPDPPAPPKITTKNPDGTVTVVQDPEKGIFPDGQHCNICGEGPFRRVAQHITRMHPETTMVNEEEPPPLSDNQTVTSGTWTNTGNQTVTTGNQTVTTGGTWPIDENVSDENDSDEDGDE